MYRNRNLNTESQWLKIYEDDYIGFKKWVMRPAIEEFEEFEEFVDDIKDTQINDLKLTTIDAWTFDHYMIYAFEYYFDFKANIFDELDNLDKLYNDDNKDDYIDACKKHVKLRACGENIKEQLKTKYDNSKALKTKNMITVNH